MAETSQPIPKEARNFRAKKSSRAEESRQRMMAGFEERTALMNKEKTKKVIGELRGKLKKNEEDKQKSAEKAKRAEESRQRMMARFEERTEKINKEKNQEDDDSYEVSDRVKTSEQNSVASGEINNDVDLEPEKSEVGDAIKELKRLGKEKDIANAKLDKIFEAYEGAANVDDFADFMLKHSDMALTKERAESDPSIKQYLESKFDEEKTGLRYDDLVQALPSKEDYVQNALGKKPKKDAEKESRRTKHVSTMPELQEFGVIEEKPPIGVAMQDLRKKLKKHAESKQSAKSVAEVVPEKVEEEAVEAEVLPLAKPGKGAKKEKKGKDVVDVEFEEKPSTNEERPLMAAARESAAKEELPKTFEGLQQFIANSSNVVEATSKLVDRQVERQMEPVRKEIKEIDEFFRKKYKDMQGGDMEKFLMGPEIKGWFKGKERKMQARYKELRKKFWEILGTGTSAARRK